MGRKSLYEEKVAPLLEDIKKWYELDSEKQIAEKLGISVATFENYKKKYPELREALTKGKENLIGELKASLKKKAHGFHYKEKKTYFKKEGDKDVKIVEEYERYALPDTGAIHLLLKNLDPTWRNDDLTTVELKREKLELEKKKADENNW